MWPSTRGACSWTGDARPFNNDRRERVAGRGAWPGYGDVRDGGLHQVEQQRYAVADVAALRVGSTSSGTTTPTVTYWFRPGRTSGTRRAPPTPTRGDLQRHRRGRPAVRFLEHEHRGLVERGRVGNGRRPGHYDQVFGADDTPANTAGSPARPGRGWRSAPITVPRVQADAGGNSAGSHPRRGHRGPRDVTPRRCR